MKLFKQIDLGLQLAVILICGILILFYKDFLFISYFVILGYQALSTLSHAFLYRYYQQLRARRLYNIMLLATIILSSSFFIYTTAAIYITVSLLLSSPFLIIWYLYICYEEKKRLEYKEFVHLK